MGTVYQFICESCGYKAKVSGGEDCGMSVVTKTIVCLVKRSFRRGMETSGQLPEVRVSNDQR
jgi:hypothetical protein